jgi:hypothetical protein
MFSDFEPKIVTFLSRTTMIGIALKTPPGLLRLLKYHRTTSERVSGVHGKHIYGLTVNQNQREFHFYGRGRPPHITEKAQTTVD